MNTGGKIARTICEKDFSLCLLEEYGPCEKEQKKVK